LPIYIVRPPHITSLFSFLAHECGLIFVVQAVICLCLTTVIFCADEVFLLDELVHHTVDSEVV